MMRHANDRWRRVLLGAMGCVLVGAPPVQATDFTLEKVAAVGDVAPGTGGGTFDLIALAGQNSLGEVAFNALITGGTASSGIFLYSGGLLTAQVLDGDPAPNTGGGTFSDFEISTDPIDDSSTISFKGDVSGGSVSHGIFTSNSGGVTEIGLPGDPAPGAGGFYSGLQRPVRHQAAHAVFASFVSGGSAYGGLFLHTGATATGRQKIALPGEVAPGTGGQTYASLPIPLSINPSGEALFIAPVSGGGTGLFRAQAISVSLSALTGDVAPGTGGGTLSTALGGTISSIRRVVLRGNVVGGTKTGGIFTESGGVLSEVVFLGDPAPPITGGTYSAFSDPYGNSAGDVSFPSNLSGGLSGSGCFLASSGDVEAVVLEGQEAPGTGGAIFSDLFPQLCALSDSGKVMFEGALSSGGTGLYLATPITPLAMGSLAGLAGPLHYQEDFDDETAFPTAAPEVDPEGIGPLSTLVSGNGPPPPPTLAFGSAVFSLTDTAGALPVEFSSLGTAAATIGGLRDVGVAGRFDVFAGSGGTVNGTGVSLTTSGGTAFRAEINDASGGTLVVTESVAGVAVDQVFTSLGGVPTGRFLVELLVDRQAGIARGLYRDALGDVVTSDLVLTSAVDETVTTFGVLAFVLNGGGAASADVELLELQLYAHELIPEAPLAGVGAGIAAAFGILGAWALRGRRVG